MTNHEADLERLSDAALADRARDDDTAAFAELWRRHASAGTMAARQFATIADPQDIVSEAYLRILRVLQQGGGPHEAFRPYLYRTIRNIALDWRSRHPSVSLDETAELVEDGDPIEVTVLENAVTSEAFEKLPERWQAVLWYLEVEGMSPTDAAPHLGLSPNATSALAARANEGFKRAWLQAHVNDRSVPAECRWTTERMSGYVRHSLTRRARARFDRHLDECDRCALLVLEIGELDGQLASMLLPLALGATAGSLLLAHLRDQAMGTMAGTASAALTAVTAAPVTVTATSAAAAASSAAAALLIAASVWMATGPGDAPAPTSASAGDSSTAPSQRADNANRSTSPARDDAPSADTEDEDAAGDPAGVAPDTTVAPIAAHATPVTQITAPPAPPAVDTTTPASAPLIDLSVSLLSGTVELDAVVDLDPSSGLLVQLVPGLSLFGN